MLGLQISLDGLVDPDKDDGAGAVGTGRRATARFFCNAIRSVTAVASPAADIVKLGFVEAAHGAWFIAIHEKYSLMLRLHCECAVFDVELPTPTARRFRC